MTPEETRQKLIKSREDLDKFLSSIPERINIVGTEFENLYNIVPYRMTDDQQMYYDVLIERIRMLQQKVNDDNKAAVVDPEKKMLIDRFVMQYPIELLTDETLEKFKRGEIIPVI